MLFIVQIVVEGLPVSSSGHVVLLERLLQSYTNHYPLVWGALDVSSDAYQALMHLLHAPTAVILALFFLGRWLFLLQYWPVTWRIIIKLIFLTAVADSTTSIFFFFFKCVPIPMPLSVGFFATACLLGSLSLLPAQKPHVLNWRIACMLGVVQGLALLPGISRFAAVYVAARWFGLSHTKSFEITFMIQWPLIVAASLYGGYVLILKDMLWPLITGNMCVIIVGASVIAYILLIAAERMARSEKLWWFGFYMMIPMLLAMIY